MDNKNLLENFDEQKDEINLTSLLNIAKRNRKFILLITFTGAILSIIQSLIATPVYKGAFKIIVSTDSSQGFQPNSLNSISNSFMYGGGNGSDNDLATQIEVLKSPYVLKPVFEYVQKQKGYDLNPKKQFFYENWFKRNIDVSLEEGTSVVKVIYKDTDEELIMESLNLISEKYRNYSRQLKNKQLATSINFLNLEIKDRKLLVSKSLDDLNKYVIENNLGSLNFGNFFNESIQSQNADGSDLINNTSIDLGIGERISERSDKFDLLKKTESEYLRLSSILTDESNTLKSARRQINKIKEELKKPTEIILDFNQKKRNIFLELETLKQLEAAKLNTQLEFAREKDPWKLIYEPTIDPTRISPRRKQSVFLGTLLSLFLSYIGTIIYEAKLRRIYEISDFKKIFRFKFLNNLFLSNLNLSNKLLDKIVQESNEKNGKKIGFFILNDIYQEQVDKNKFKLIFQRKEFKHIKLFSDIEYNEYSFFIILLDNNYVSHKNLNFSNEYFGLFKDKIFGWLYVQ